MSEGGRAAVRATVRLSATLSMLGGDGSNGDKHNSKPTATPEDSRGTMSPSKAASLASSTYRPTFTVSTDMRNRRIWARSQR